MDPAPSVHGPRRVTPEVICLAIALTTGAADPAGAVRGGEVAATERAVGQVSARLHTWLEDPSPTAATAIRERVALGAPPAALIALLDELRSTPRASLLDVVQSLATYRRADVRGHAFAAWAEFGPEQAERAIAAAAVDLDPSVRRLVPALAARHPSERVEQLVVDLLDRDTELAAAMAEDDAAEIELLEVSE